MTRRSLVSLALFTLASACGCGGGDKKGTSASASAALPDMAVKELCPPKPPAHEDRRGDPKGPTPEQAKMRAALTDAVARRPVAKEHLEAACNKIAEELADGKPLPAGPIKLDDKNSFVLDDPAFRKVLQTLGGIAAECRAVASSAAKCDKLPEAQKQDCVLRHAFFQAARNPKNKSWRYTDAEVAFCKKTGASAADCQATAAAIRSGDASKCPAQSTDCVARASLDESKCAKDANLDGCKRIIERDKLVVAGGLEKLKEAGSDVDKRDAAAVLDKKSGCEPTLAELTRACADLRNVQPTLFPPAEAPNPNPNPPAPAAPSAPSPAK